MFDGVGHRIPNVSFQGEGGGGKKNQFNSILFFLINKCVCFLLVKFH